MLTLKHFGRLGKSKKYNESLLAPKTVLLLLEKVGNARLGESD